MYDVSNTWKAKYPTAMEVLYLSTKKVTKNWNYTQPEWGETLKELGIIFEGRI